jgi:hypothetical protein
VKIEIHANMYVRPSEEGNLTNEKLDAILKMLRESKTREVLMSQEMDALTAEVKVNTDLDDSIVALLNGLSAQILDAAGDRTKATALAGELKAKSEALAAAITANTPAAPAA